MNTEVGSVTVTLPESLPLPQVYARLLGWRYFLDGRRLTVSEMWLSDESLASPPRLTHRNPVIWLGRTLAEVADNLKRMHPLSVVKIDKDNK